MSINMPQAIQTSPFERLLGAVKGVGEAKTAIEKIAGTDPEEQKRQRLLDPTSKESKLARADAQAYLTMIGGSELSKKNPGAFLPLQHLASDETTSADTLKTSFESSPLLKHVTSLANKSDGSALASAVWGNRKEMQTDRQDQAAHQRTLSALKRDPQLAKRVANYQNLENALSNVTQADFLTPQQIHEFQQTVRNSLGIGAGGVGEREHTYINTLGLKAENFMQLISGDPAQISKDSSLVKHFKNLAMIEQKNIGHQLEKRLNAVTAGNGSMYSRRPDLKGDLMDAIDAQKEQFSAPGQQALQGADPSLGGPQSAQAAVTPSPEETQSIQRQKRIAELRAKMAGGQ